MATKTNTTNSTASPITEAQYQEALTITQAYQAERAAALAALRDLYAVPVSALVASDAFKTVYAALVAMITDLDPDGSLSMNVEALKQISKAMAGLVGVDMDAPVESPATTPDATHEA